MVRGKKWDGSFEKRSKWHVKPLTKFTLPRLSHLLPEEWQNKFIPVFLRSYFQFTMSLELQFFYALKPRVKSLVARISSFMREFRVS